MIVNETILGFLRYLEKFIAIKCYLVLLYQIAFGNFHQTPIYIVPKYYIAKFSVVLKKVLILIFFFVLRSLTIFLRNDLMRFSPVAPM